MANQPSVAGWGGAAMVAAAVSALLLASSCGGPSGPLNASEGSAAGSAARGPFYAFDDAGDLIRPEGYRRWIYVGTPVTPNELNNGEAAFPEFHNVYIDPVSFAHWEATGLFREGTIMMKELVLVGSKQARSGTGYFMGEFVGLEATIKSQEHFPDEPGNWAYYSFGHSYPLAATATAAATAACNTCHETSAADDFVFTQYYPVLRSAKGGTSGGEALAPAAQGAAVAQPPSGPQPRGESPGPVPTDDAALFTYLSGRGYESFAAHESANHPSRGPHTRNGLPVRVYMDPTLAASLEAGNTNHPRGASVVKEMFDDSGTLQGWAVMVKTEAEGDGGRGWFWYEITTTAAGAAPDYSGNGLALCSGCHASGQDFILTGFPLN